MLDTITSRPCFPHGTTVSATVAPTRGEAGDDMAGFYEQLQTLATQQLGRTALLNALFDLQLNRASVVACAAFVRRSDGTLAPGATRSRISKADFDPLKRRLADACEWSLSDGRFKSTYTASDGVGAICVPIQTGAVAALVTLTKHSDDAHRRATEIMVAQLVAAQVDCWSVRQRLAESADQLANSAATVELVQRIEATGGVKSACFTVAAALKQHLRCERVVVGLKRRGQSCRLVAVSGAAEVDSQAGESRRMKAALDECLVRNELGVWPPLTPDRTGDHSAPPTGGLHQLLAHKQLARDDSCVISTPLKTADGESVGALLIVGREIASLPRVACFAESLGEPLGSALSISQRAEGSRLCRLARACFAPAHRRKRWIAAGLAVAMVALMMVPVPYKVACRSLTEPVTRRFCVAPHEGLLQHTLAEPGDMVARGQRLAQMDGREIRWELVGVTADRSRAAKRRDTHMAHHETPDALLAELEMKRLESRARLLRFRQQNLDVVSPIDGIVLSGSLDRRENYPVTKGQVLYEIAPLDSLRVEVSVPADEVTRARPGMTVEMTFDGLGGQLFAGELTRIRPRSEIRDDDNVFVGEVVIENTERQLRPGMKGRAKIVSEQREIGWIVFHRAWEKMRTAWPW